MERNLKDHKPSLSLSLPPSPAITPSGLTMDVVGSPLVLKLEGIKVSWLHVAGENVLLCQLLLALERVHGSNLGVGLFQSTTCQSACLQKGCPQPIPCLWSQPIPCLWSQPHNTNTNNLQQPSITPDSPSPILDSPSPIPKPLT